MRQVGRQRRRGSSSGCHVHARPKAPSPRSASLTLPPPSRDCLCPLRAHSPALRAAPANWTDKDESEAPSHTQQGRKGPWPSMCWGLSRGHGGWSASQVPDESSSQKGWRVDSDLQLDPRGDHDGPE